MIILSETGGQTCNKFFQYLYYLKKAIREKKRLIVQLPDVTIEDYPNLLNNEYISFPFYSHKLTNIVGVKRSLRATQLITVGLLNNYTRFILHQLSFGRLDFVSGKPTWTGTDESYDDIQKELNYLFQLKDTLKDEVDGQFPAEDGALVCGVHMRGGDYRQWLGGKYFFEQKIYRRVMDKLLRLHPDKKIRFLICSNEEIDKEVFSGIDYLTIPGAKASQDIYALSRCDYIIGTLSSFNAWASLIGQVPLYTLLNESDIDSLQLSDFSPVINYKEKRNGWNFPRSSTFYAKVPHPWLYRHSNKEHLLNLKYD